MLHKMLFVTNPSAPTAHRRRSCCVVGQTSKAEASNSFSVTLGDPAALRFLHMYTDKLIFLTNAHLSKLLSCGCTVISHPCSPPKISVVGAFNSVPQSVDSATRHCLKAGDRNLSQLSWPLDLQVFEICEPSAADTCNPMQYPQCSMSGNEQHCNCN